MNRRTLAGALVVIATSAAACTSADDATPSTSDPGPTADIPPLVEYTADDVTVTAVARLGAGRAIAAAASADGTTVILTTGEVHMARPGDAEPTPLDTFAVRRHPVIAVTDDGAVAAVVEAAPPQVVWYDLAARTEIARADLPTATPPDWLAFRPGTGALLLGTDQGPLAWSPPPDADSATPVSLSQAAVTGPPAFLADDRAVVPLLGERSVAVLSGGAMLLVELDIPETAALQSLRSSPDGAVLGALVAVGDEPAGRPSEIHLLDTRSLRPERAIPLGRPLEASEWLVTDDAIAIVLNDRIELLDPTGEPVRTLNTPELLPVGALVPAPDGFHSIRDDGSVTNWTAPDWEPEMIRDPEGTSPRISVGSTGEPLAIVDPAGVVEVRSVDDPDDPTVYENFANGSLTAVDVATDGSIAAASDQGIVVLAQRDLVADTRLVVADGPSRVDSVAFRPDKAELATGLAAQLRDLSFDETLTLWDLDRLGSFFQSDGSVGATPGGAFVHRLRYDPTGSLLASASQDRTVAIRDARSGELVHQLPARTGPILDLRFAADGTRLIVSADDDQIEVWNVGGWNLATRLESTVGGYTAFDVVPGDASIVAASDTGELSRIDLETGAVDVVFDAELAVRPSVVEVSPDGRLAASPLPDGTVGIWSTVSGLQLAAIDGHAEGVTGVVFDPSGDRIVTVSSDGTLRSWSLEISQPTF